MPKPEKRILFDKHFRALLVMSFIQFIVRDTIHLRDYYQRLLGTLKCFSKAQSGCRQIKFAEFTARRNSNYNAIKFKQSFNKPLH